MEIDNLIKMYTRGHLKEYAYLLGVYLGNGCLVNESNSANLTLRIVLDNKYPNLIHGVVNIVEKLAPFQYVSVRDEVNWTRITCTYFMWHNLFPQHGPGKKHEREIKLESWQIKIIDQYPKEFIKGLIHTDGCRTNNRLTIMYSFDNSSKDITLLFIKYLGKLGIIHTLCYRPDTKQYTVAIRRKISVNQLDKFIGPKQ